MGAAQVSGSSGDRASSGRSHACAGIGSRRGAGGACARDTVAGGVALVGADPAAVSVRITSLATPEPSAEGLVASPSPALDGG